MTTATPRPENTSGPDGVEQERDALRELNRELAVALEGLRYRNECWCEVAIDNPNMRGEHSADCVKAQKALAKAKGGGA